VVASGSPDGGARALSATGAAGSRFTADGLLKVRPGALAGRAATAGLAAAPGGDGRNQFNPLR
jgi:hypothetical protein